MYLVAELQTTIDKDTLKEELNYIICGKEENDEEVNGSAYSTIEKAEEKYHEILNRAAISNYYKHGAMIMDEECTPLKYYYFLHKEAAEIEHIVVQFTWNDENDNDAYRPESNQVEVKLIIKKGEEQIGDPISENPTITGNVWNYDFGNYYAYNNKDKLTFIISVEGIPEQYSESVDGYNYIYTHNPIPIETPFSGTITWNDGSSQSRPNAVVNLYLCDSEEEEEDILIESVEVNNSYVFDGEYYKYYNKNGVQTNHIYKIEEVVTTGDEYRVYTPRQSGKQLPENFVVDFTNDYKEYSDINVSIKWVDNDPSQRPTDENKVITVKLKHDSIVKSSGDINPPFEDMNTLISKVLINENGDSVGWGLVEEYDGNENSIPNYSISYDNANYIITNTYTESSDEEEQTQE